MVRIRLMRVGAKGAPREFDGSGANDSKITYGGKGGVPLGNLMSRLAFAVKYGQINFLLNGAASAPGARVIFNREPRDRVLKVAPFLKVDSDPYPSVINGRVVWILDAYTTSDGYPYSQAVSGTAATDGLLGGSFNYIRNSVKVVIDAYDGTVTFYAMDEKEPVLAAYARIFPGLFRPFVEMPADLGQWIEWLGHPEAEGPLAPGDATQAAAGSKRGPFT
jgi:hypothetical protein